MNELQSLSQIFQNRIFRIPDYQRGYAWLDPQLRDFWEDLINLQADRYHYTGLLSLKILTRKESKKLDKNDQWLLNNGYKAYHVVDGQQRLTTFVVLLNEIIDFTRKLPENLDRKEEEIFLGYESLKDIRAKYICRMMPPSGLVITYLFGYENDNPSAEYLKYRVFGEKYGGSIRETYYTKNLKYAKQFFVEELKRYYDIKGVDGLSQLYHKLTLQLMFNIHEIEDDYDVFVAFETMNNRGKKLTNLELLKNRLIYLTTLYNKDILDEDNEAALREKINRAWKEVYYQLGRNENEPLSDDEFLRAHWIMYFAYSRQKGDDYIRFLLRKFSHKSIFEDVLSAAHEDEATDDIVDPELEDEGESEAAADLITTASGEFLQPSEIADYVNSLNETAEYWYYTFYPNECKSLGAEEKLWLDRLNRIGIGYFRPIVAVSLLPDLGFSCDERIAFFRAIERFTFINFRMAMYQSSYLSSEYYRKTRDLYKGILSIGEITAALNNKTDINAPDAVKIFVTRMNRRFITADGFYSWRDLRYFLYEYEYTLFKKYKIEKLDWGMLTKVVKDKITVEHILPQTPTKYYWRNQFRQYTAEEIKTLSASLGNLLPLSQSINSSLQNDPFEEKKARGYVNGSHSEIEVSKETDWDAKRIYDRGNKLLHFMEKRWGFEFESQDQIDELLHVGFVNDGREIPPEIPVGEESTPAVPPACQSGSIDEIRFEYWKYALPLIQEAQGGAGHPFGNVNPSSSNYKDGFFGVAGIHLYCGIALRPYKASAGLWIDTGKKESSKAIFDALYSHKDEIESKISMPIIWVRKDDHRACSISVALSGVDFTNSEEWPTIAGFHAKMLKELADYAFYPYQDEIAAAQQ